MSFERIDDTAGLLRKIKFLSFIVFIVGCFFLLSYIFAVEFYELSKWTSHLLSVSLSPKCVRSLSWFSSFFYFNYLPDDVICKTAFNSSCDKLSDLCQQFAIDYEL